MGGVPARRTAPRSGVYGGRATLCGEQGVLNGAFNHTRRYATQYLAYVPPPGADGHRRIIVHLERQQYNKIARRLEALRTRRNRCDYHESVSDLAAITVDALADAQCIVGTLVFY